MISEKVFTFDPRITVYSISAGAQAQLPDGAWQRPTLTVALNSQFKLNVLSVCPRIDVSQVRGAKSDAAVCDKRGEIQRF